MKNTAVVELEAFNRALLILQHLSGEVSHVKINPIIMAFQQSIIPEPKIVEKEGLRQDIYATEAEKAEKECPSATPQKS